MGGTKGRAPVLIKTCPASISSRLPSAMATATWRASRKEPSPVKTVTLGWSASLW